MLMRDDVPSKTRKISMAYSEDKQGLVERFRNERNVDLELTYIYVSGGMCKVSKSSKQ